MQKTKSERLTAVLTNVIQMKSEKSDPYKGEVRMPDMQKTKSERLTTVLTNVIQIKSEHLIHIKAKSERLICIRRSLNV